MKFFEKIDILIHALLAPLGQTINRHIYITGIAVLLNHRKKPEVKVAIDGSLYKYHPHLHDMMTAEVTRLAPHTKVG